MMLLWLGCEARAQGLAPLQLIRVYPCSSVVPS